MNQYTSSLTLSTNTASTITSASLVQTNFNASEATDLTFTITLINDIATDGLISLIYPSQVTVSGATLEAELTSPSSIASLTLALTSSSRRIDIVDMFPSGASAGETYVFLLKNIVNSDEADDTSSFQITTYTDVTGAYSIDRVRTGLIMSADCDYP